MESLSGMIEWLKRLLPFAGSEMSCIKLRQLASEYLDGEMDARTLWRFRFHMERCGGCGAFVSTLKATIDTLNSLPNVPAPVDLRERIASDIPGNAGGASGSA